VCGSAVYDSGRAVQVCVCVCVCGSAVNDSGRAVQVGVCGSAVNDSGCGEKD